MIVVSASAPRSGSVWYANMTNEMLVEAGFDDAYKVREQFGLSSLMQPLFVNGKLHFYKLARLCMPHFLGKTYVFKTHEYPTRGLRILTSFGITKSTYIYRDPRDRLISLLDWIMKRRGLSDFTDEMLERAVGTIGNSLKHFRAWQDNPHTLTLKYEELSRDTVSQLEKTSDFLKLNLPTPTLARIAASYAKESQSPTKKESHMNVGIIGRHKTTFNDSQRQYVEEQLRDDIIGLGYSL